MCRRTITLLVVPLAGGQACRDVGCRSLARAAARPGRRSPGFARPAAAAFGHQGGGGRRGAGNLDVADAGNDTATARSRPRNVPRVDTGARSELWTSDHQCTRRRVFEALTAFAAKTSGAIVSTMAAKVAWYMRDLELVQMRVGRGVPTSGSRAREEYAADSRRCLAACRPFAASGGDAATSGDSFDLRGCALRLCRHVEWVPKAAGRRAVGHTTDRTCQGRRVPRWPHATPPTRQDRRFAGCQLYEDRERVLNRLVGASRRLAELLAVGTRRNAGPLAERVAERGLRRVARQA